MKDIVFEQRGDCHQFLFKDEKGTDFCFEYFPSLEGLWKDINLEDFDVQLIIHPFLNNESNVFALESNLKTAGETVGYVFPISVLDSNSFEPRRPSDNNYLFVAYNVLLERLPYVSYGKNTLGSCFEENICVCVLNLRTIGRSKRIQNCIHSLRKYGYSYFVEGNRYKQIDGYTIKNYKDLLPGSRMKVDFLIPSMYTDSIIDGILRSLPNADNLVYRFILLYQIVEFLISKKINASIQNVIDIYQSSPLCSENDFLEKISNIRKERGVINEILSICHIKRASIDCFVSFSKACRHLFDMAGVVYQKKEEEDLFYSFRNQMVHSYRHLSQFREDLARTIFYFEQIVLTIVEKYPYDCL